MRITGVVLLLFAAACAGQDSNGSDAEKLIQTSDCSSCHALDRQVVGPAYSTIAKRYAGHSDAIARIADKIREGGSGMTPHPDLTQAQRQAIAAWILGRPHTGGASHATPAKQYSYKLKDGTTTKLDFPIFSEADNQKVTKEVFHGYQLYNSYCYRCHGTDATGGELGPDLRRSLGAGMKLQEFLSVAMSGRKEQGMPAWAGFLSEDDVIHVYRYVKARSLDLISSGRPPSEQD